MAISITIDQTGKPAGTPGQAREDLALGTNVTLTVNGGPFNQVLWSIIDKPVDYSIPAQSAATLTSFDSTVTQVQTVDKAGTYLVQVAVDVGFGLGARQEDIARITFYAGPTLGAYGSLPVREPAFAEKREHNIPDLVFPGGQPRGWTQPMQYWFGVIKNFVSVATRPRFEYGIFGVYALAVIPGVFDTPKRVDFTGTISGVTLLRRTAGASGNTQVDIRVNGNSIHSGSPPVVQASNGDYDTITVTSFNAFASVVPGNYVEAFLIDVEAYNAGPPEGPEGLFVLVKFS